MLSRAEPNSENVSISPEISSLTSANISVFKVDNVFSVNLVIRIKPDNSKELTASSLLILLFLIFSAKVINSCLSVSSVSFKILAN